MIDLYNFINDLGYLSADYFWFPLLIWSAIAALTFFILRVSDSINPLYQYHIRIATLFALPVGLFSTFMIQFLSNLSPSGVSANPAVFVVSNPLQENTASLYMSEATPLNWMDGNILIGSFTLVIILIAAFFLLRLIRDYIQLRILYSQLETEPLTNLESEYGLKDQSVSIAFNDHPLVPFTFGWRKPVIVLPSRIKNNSENLNMAIRHELVHIQRGDYLIQLFLSMISSLFWFHPFVKMSEKKIETFREISCDQQVLNTSEIHPKNYAKMLVELIPLQNGIGSFAVNMAVQQSTLKQRIEKMKYHKLHKTSLKKSFMLFLGIIMVVIAPIACSDLQGPSLLTEEEILSEKVTLKEFRVDINGKEVLDASDQGSGVSIEGINAITLNPDNYGLFEISLRQFEGGILAGSIDDNTINFKINQLSVSIVSKARILSNNSQAQVWVKHYPNVQIPLSYGTSTTPGELAPPPPPSPPNPERDVFVVVENMPELVGGQAGIQSKVEYPPTAIRAGIEGRVTVQFIVDKNGNVTDPKIIRGIGGGCDEEALRVVSNAKFKPGTQRGRPVDVQMSMPVLFKLSDSKFKQSDNSENYPPPPPPRPMKVETLDADNGSIKVKLSTGSDPLVGATVTIKDGSRGAATNREGIAIISGLEKGTYTIVASFVGYGKHEKKITVN